MIKKLSSKEIMDVIESSSRKLQDLEMGLSCMENNILKQMEMISDMHEYSLAEAAVLGEKPWRGDSESFVIVPAEDEIVCGAYDRYGVAVHPEFLKEPVNVFNFRTEAGWIYKNNATVYMDGEHRAAYNSVLMHDSILGKETVYERFSRKNISVEIVVEEGTISGGLYTNTLEILPVIPGSFDINSIEIFTDDDRRTRTLTGSILLDSCSQNCMPMRIFLGKTVKLYKAILNININWQNSGGLYPFGLRHLYFLKTDINPDSYAVFKVKENFWINTIGEDVVIKGQNGIRESGCAREGIRFFSSYSNGELSYELETSRGLSRNPLARNVREIYARVPLRESILSIQLRDITKR